jgi:nitrite reductase (NO-forming)
VKPRVTTALYQSSARTWLTLAALSFLLPVRWRLGLWLPLHLTLAGAVSTAISGAMQNFMLSLTASPDPPDRVVRTQFALVTTGAALIAIGMPTTTPWLTGLGGTAFVGAMGLLGWMLWRAWRRALNVRHAVPLFAYAAAIGFVLLGGTLGALMGSRTVSVAMYAQVRHAHLTANVLGWASLTVVGTLITLLPTALRVRMPQRRERVVVGLLASGVLLQVAGWLADSTPALSTGGVVFAAGALGFIGFVAAVLRTERRWAVPAAAFHMLAAFAWFVAGSVGLAIALVDGTAGADRYREVFLTAFVGGWLVQVLLGAWSYLLPMARPGHPTDRRRWLSVFELAVPVQVASLNAGLLLLAGTGAGWVGPGLGLIGAALAFVGGGIALAKAWFFAAADWPAATERARAVWGE